MFPIVNKAWEFPTFFVKTIETQPHVEGLDWPEPFAPHCGSSIPIPIFCYEPDKKMCHTYRCMSWTRKAILENCDCALSSIRHDDCLCLSQYTIPRFTQVIEFRSPEATLRHPFSKPVPRLSFNFQSHCWNIESRVVAVGICAVLLRKNGHSTAHQGRRTVSTRVPVRRLTVIARETMTDIVK